MGCAGSSSGVARVYQKYDFGEKLGQGGFGQVRLARARNPSVLGHDIEREKRQTPEEYAVKMIFLCARQRTRRRRTKRDVQLLRNAEKEVAMWRRVSDCENCVQLYETFKDRHFYYMVMEKCKCSVLQDLEQMLNVSEKVLGRVFGEMLRGIGYLHDRNLVHRDVKLENFLLGGPDGKTVKLADFGLATELPTSSVLRLECGTGPYKAPEMLHGRGYLQTVDVWSLGVCVYLILCGVFPYSPIGKGKSFEDIVRQGQPAPDFKRIVGVDQPTEQAVDFARNLLDRSVETRCTIKQGLQLLFVNTELASQDTARPEDAGDGNYLPNLSLRAAIGKARQHTLEFKTDVDDTEQQDVDEILESLQTWVLPSARSCNKFRKQKRCFTAEARLSGHSNVVPSAGCLSRGITHCGTVTLSIGKSSRDVDEVSKSTDEGDSNSTDSLVEVECDEPGVLGAAWQDLPHVILS
jgi:serine/threonine protein kinase